MTGGVVLITGNHVEVFSEDPLRQLRAAGGGVADGWEAFCQTGVNAGKPGPCPEGQAQPVKQGRIAAWASAAKHLPHAAMSKARSLVGGKYKALEGRYGRKWAVAIMGAGLAGLPIPAPGASLLTAAPMIAAAELHRAFAGHAVHAERFAELTPQQVTALGKRFIAGLRVDSFLDREVFAGTYGVSGGGSERATALASHPGTQPGTLESVQAAGGGVILPNGQDARKDDHGAKTEAPEGRGPVIPRKLESKPAAGELPNDVRARPASPRPDQAEEAQGHAGLGTPAPADLPAGHDIALPGHDGERAAELLKNAQAHGAQVLADIAHSAVTRLLAKPRRLKAATTLFDDDEMKRLADMLAETTATANLLGRSKIRIQQARAVELAEKYDENEPTSFTAFADDELKPLAPTRAIAYFKRLVPTLDVPAGRFSQAMRRKAFTVAKATSKGLLERVKEIISAALETGEKVSEAPRAVEKVLVAAGVHPRNPQHSEMIVRTNMMDAYSAGAEEELKEVADTFPVYRYLGIADGRQGIDHAGHFGKYFPASVPFREIRDSLIVRYGKVVKAKKGEGRAFNCRCGFQPVSKFKWLQLRTAGARIADNYTDPVK